MIWIERLRLTNWLRFEGEHEIELEQKVYAICAEHEDDPERSNWCGKTSLLEAIRFALYGTHRHSREDDWITNGEKFGKVTIELSNGIIVERSRKRGKSTQVIVIVDSGQPKPQVLVQKEAQQYINDLLVGMTEDDSVATWYFGQRELPRVILQTPAERMTTVGAWLELEPLQRCEERARDQLRAVGDELRQLHRDREVAAEQMKQIFAHHEVEKTAQLILKWEHAKTNLAAAEEAMAGAGEGAERLAKWQRADQMAAQFDQLVVEGKQTKKELDAAWDGDTDPDRQMHADNLHRLAVENLGKARAAVDQKRQLARGKFDGNCPVGDCPCPIVDDLNARREENARGHTEAAERFGTLQNEAMQLKQDTEEIDDRKRERDRLLYRGQDLKKQAGKLLAAKRLIDEIGPAPEDHDNDDEGLRLRRDTAAVVLAGLERDIDRFDELNARLEQLGADQGDIDERLKLARQAAWIFGRDGAQKRAAERALGEIESGANARLRQCEIDLSIAVQWGRAHSTKLAEQCEGCGASLPASKRVKVCPDCKAERGPKVIPRLDVALSDRSGAADDIGGMAFQLSASDWLRSERDTRWGLACIDEPWAQCDVANKTRLATHLVQMLGGSFQQSLVVTHDRAVADMLPGRIVVRADDKRSWLEVM